MSEADSTSRRRPPTIDLTAKEVEAAKPDANPAADAEQATSAPEAPPGSRPGGSSGRALPYIVGIAAGAVGIAAVAAAVWYAGLVPLHDTGQPQSAASLPDGQGTQATVTEEISKRL